MSIDELEDLWEIAQQAEYHAAMAKFSAAQLSTALVTAINQEKKRATKGRGKKPKPKKAKRAPVARVPSKM